MMDEKKLTQNLNDDQLNTVDGGGISFSKLPNPTGANLEGVDEQINQLLNELPEESHYLVPDIMELEFRRQLEQDGGDPLAIENIIRALKEDL